MQGEKTKKLRVLKDAGFNVPNFVGFGSEEMEIDASEIAHRAVTKLGTTNFAVRSSAFVEDSGQSSMAGQFLTKVNVTKDELADAIDEVRNHAKQKLGDLKNFSLIIQEFIEADISGITFTRNPQGGREMIFEFHQGRGEEIVSGKVTPTREEFYRTQKEYTSKIPNIYRAKTTFLEIEKCFAFPQDIEWCIKNGELFILQSRPITSIKKEEAEYWNSLERVLPHEEKYFFAKTELCDGVPRPSHDTFLLLQKMYEKEGPMDRAYKTFGIMYCDTKFLVRIMGELYVDKEKELQSIFPSHSYFFAKAYTPMPVRLAGFLRTLKNGARLRAITGEYEEYKKKIEELLRRPFSKSSYDEAERQFLEEYQWVAEVSLLVQAALRRLKENLPQHMSLAKALMYMPKGMSAPLAPPSDATGNTLNLEDASPLSVVLASGDEGEVPAGVPEKDLREAQEFLRLKEYGRWLAQRHLARLRALRVPGPHNDKRGVFAGPYEITDTPRKDITKGPIGVSGGEAAGALTTDPRAGGILVVHDLSPELFAYKASIAGVIAEHGGMLSHFAILAREEGIPVIVNYPIRTLSMGKYVQINGGTGEVILGEKDA